MTLVYCQQQKLRTVHSFIHYGTVTVLFRAHSSNLLLSKWLNTVSPSKSEHIQQAKTTDKLLKIDSDD